MAAVLEGTLFLRARAKKSQRVVVTGFTPRSSHRRAISRMANSLVADGSQRWRRGRKPWESNVHAGKVGVGATSVQLIEQIQLTRDRERLLTALCERRDVARKAAVETPEAIERAGSFSCEGPMSFTPCQCGAHGGVERVA